MTSTASPYFPRGLGKVGFSTELPAGYAIRSTGDGYVIYWGARPIDGGYDTYASACFAAQEHAAVIADEEAAAAEAEAEYDGNLAQQVAQSAADLIYALDRGDFGAGHRFSDGSESAYVADLRAKLAAYRKAA